MRSEITKRDEKIAALSRQVNAAFVPYEIYSDDKLQYVADGLTRAKFRSSKKAVCSTFPIMQ